MLDRFGKLHTARVAANGAVALNDAARHIGVAGRPLGFTFDAVGRMLICDPVAGLLRYTAPGSGQPRAVTEVLSNGLADGTSIRSANDVAVARDGTIYFTASSDQAVGFGAADELGGGFYDTMTGSKLNLVHGAPTGRLLRYDAHTGETTVLHEGLWFANGVALDPDEKFVLVCETFAARVWRHWLGNSTIELFADRLPGFPDGLRPREGGGYWVGLVNPPSVLVKLPLRSRALRAVMGHITALLEPFIPRWGCVAHLGADGAKVKLLVDREGTHVQSISSVHQHGRRLYLGNLMNDYVTYLDLEPGE